MIFPWFWQCLWPVMWSRNKSVVEPKLFVSAPALAPNFKTFRLWFRSRLWLRLKLWKLPVCSAFKLKSRFFMFFRNEYRFNSLTLYYSIWIMIFNYYFSLTRSRSRNFTIPAPAPARSFTSLRLRLHNTATAFFCGPLALFHIYLLQGP
jgi:hypothetical protein